MRQISYGIYLSLRPLKGMFLALVEPTAMTLVPAPVAHAVGALRRVTTA